jgi:hemerythrin-like domain-containing protein
MQEKARHASAEHHELDELIADLDEISNSSPAWLAKAKALGEKIHHHLDEEEHEFFQLAGKVLDSKLKERLSDDFLKEKLRFMES